MFCPHRPLFVMTASMRKARMQKETIRLAVSQAPDSVRQRCKWLHRLPSMRGAHSHPPTSSRPASRASLLKKTPKEPNAKFSPISASGFFAEALQVAVETRNLDCRIYYTPPKFKDGTVMVCHHGAGYSGISFACFAKELTEMSKGECGVLSLDARRHGMFIFNAIFY